MNPLETYLKELSQIRSSGAAVKETSYYGPLASLFNEIGKTLKPKVKCIINLQNQGAGMPDGGFFTQEQFQKAGDHEPMPGQMPARGVIEVKSTQDDALVTADGAQVTRYLGKYRQVLVTNYRDFVLVGQDASGQAVKLEIYRLADSEADFWAGAVHPRRTTQEHGERFTEYLKRVMLHAAPLTGPADVAWFLASYARDAKARLEGKDLPALTGLRTALEEALGLKFEGDKGDHFFRSTLVQTLFYGVFAAWVLWHKKNPIPAPKQLFDWRLTPFYLRVPMIRVLYEQVAAPSKLGPLGLEEVLDWTTTVLNRVDRPAFFSQFDEGHAVQYFYEPFLKAFDPELRKDLGVWFTPPEIVQYMVARVDTVLREELSIADGLADPRVYVLDPCCGTGAYLVEVLKHIHGTLTANRDDALVAHDLKTAARDRVFGFEILPAPFVVAHLQLGLLLANLGAPLAEETAAKEGERARVYLTNALTGWEPPTGPKQQLTLPEFEAERDAAEEVKRDKPILVILGNPPYNAFAGVSAAAEKTLVEPYKEGLISRWGIKKFNLDDLYVRFFGLAERRIAGMTGKGVVCYISNFSYLGDPSFVVMRQRFLSEFDALWFDCLNGDSRETGKVTPEGRPDPSVFSTEYNREGIRVGTAVALMVREEQDVDKNGAQAPSPVPLAKPAKGEYRRNLPHLQAEDKTFFVTFSTYKRLVLPESVRGLVLQHCLHDHGKKLWVHGLVIMPDHVHLIFTPLKDREDKSFGLAEIMQGIKGASAHSINKVLQRRGKVWEEESFDRLMRSHESVIQKVEYICQNPVRKGLIREGEDYPWLWREWVEGAGPPEAVQENREEAQAGAPVLHSVVRFRQFWGVTKREDLLESLKAQDFGAQYQTVSPDITNRFTFRPSEVAGHYREWPKLVDLCAVLPNNGLMEKRGGALIDLDRAALEYRMRLYYDPDTEWETLKTLGTGLTKNAARFDAGKAREKVLKSESFTPDHLLRYTKGPFDSRWCYYSPTRPLWNEPRPALWEQCWPGNSFLLSRVKGVKTPEGVPFYYVSGLSDDHLLADDAFCFPIRLKAVPKKSMVNAGQNELFEQEAPTSPSPTANLSPAARSYLAALGFPDPDADPETAALIWLHALAIGYAPAYLTENHDGIRQDWPRVPLPDTAEALMKSAYLGREIAALLDPETPVPGVTAGALRPELKPLAMISKVGGGALNPDAGDLALTVGWGHGGKGGITMPGKGKVTTRDYTPEELAAIREGAPVLDLTPEQALAHLGESTYDIYLNEAAYWQNIPEKVWNYYIGGYQVIKKWLSYREKTLLGRPLTPDEVREVTHMARRLAAIVLTEPALNANYLRAKEYSFAWPRTQER